MTCIPSDLRYVDFELTDATHERLVVSTSALKGRTLHYKRLLGLLVRSAFASCVRNVLAFTKLLVLPLQPILRESF